MEIHLITIENGFNQKLLTPFQYDLLKTINWFNDNCGEYIYYKSKIEQQYSETMAPIRIKKEIEALEDNGWITKEVKKVLYNGRYSTKVIIKFAFGLIKNN